MSGGGPVRPSPFELWQQAEGNPEEYRRLMREHGHLVPGKPEPLPCGWPRGTASARAEPCIHDLDPASCAVCNGAEKRAAAGTFRSTAERGVYGPPFAARYPGMCAGCWEEIGPGDMIRADGDGCYLCEDCGDAA